MNTENLENITNTIDKLEEKREAAAYIDFKMVTFDLAGKDYGIDIMHVKEIAKAGHFTYVPNTLPFVLGVYNLRGEIIPILDLRIFFNIPVPPTDKTKLHNLLILSIDDQIFGLVVDKIDKVIGVQKSTIQPPHPLFGDINIKYINGVVESNNHLYVLLDVLRIFVTKENSDKKEDIGTYYQENAARQQAVRETEKTSVVSAAVKVEHTPAPVAAPVEKREIDLKFIAESLAQYGNFFVTDLNNDWVKFRYTEWEKEKNGGTTQLLNEADTQEFLKTFWSQCSSQWWSKEYADSIRELLPVNTAKTIVVWNPGCGKGMESYSLACILKEKYPDAIIKIYAQDVDLLNVSNAALMSVPDNLTATWYAPYISRKANGECTFNSDIKESIMFEYHDCKNTNVLPMVDIIFARDVLSLCDKSSQNQIITDFQEKMKGNAIAIVGDNEIIPSEFGFGEKTSGAITAYTKD